MKIDDLDWDDWNLPHVEKHGYLPADAEHICLGEHVYYTASYKNRDVILGPTRDGRILAVILGRVPNQTIDLYYVFSLRPAKRKERAFYEQEKRKSAEESTE
jgi:uncharacterized DUF497 family protein